jgi:exopolyphosphatase / guanosine-5'-triphosphate,3'-diphosphate pyrophosphatase
MRRAIIDIGTNSVKLLVAALNGGAVEPLHEASEQTRLGQGFYGTQHLQPDAIARTARAVARFAGEATHWQVQRTIVIATSAARDAHNQMELLEGIRAACGLEARIISGDEEADLAFLGVRTHPVLAAGSLLILEAGGGSSQFVFGSGAHPEARWSFPIGTVRLLEQVQPGDPPSAADWERCRKFLEKFLMAEVHPLVASRMKAAAGPTLLVGTGGTTSILAAMTLGLRTFDRDRLERATLTADQLWQYQKLLWSIPLAERQRIAGLPPNRADVILFGVAIFALVMEVFQLGTICVSTRGLRFGAALLG